MLWYFLEWSIEFFLEVFAWSISQRREMLLFLTLRHQQHVRRDITCKPAMINWEKQLDAARTCCGLCEDEDKFRPNTSQANCFEGFWRTTNKIKAKIEVRKRKKSLRAIHQAGYVCHTSAANAMYSFSLSLLPSKHCLFWCLLSASICLLVLTRYFDEKLRNKASFGSKQSRTGDTEVSSLIMLIKSHLHNLKASENMNLKKIPVDHYHNANQYSVAALARPQEKKVTFKNIRYVALSLTLRRSVMHSGQLFPAVCFWKNLIPDAVKYWFSLTSVKALIFLLRLNNLSNKIFLPFWASINDLTRTPSFHIAVSSSMPSSCPQPKAVIAVIPNRLELGFIIATRGETMMIVEINSSTFPLITCINRVLTEGVIIDQ